MQQHLLLGMEAKAGKKRETPPLHKNKMRILTQYLAALKHDGFLYLLWTKLILNAVTLKIKKKNTYAVTQLLHCTLQYSNYSS